MAGSFGLPNFRTPDNNPAREAPKPPTTAEEAAAEAEVEKTLNPEKEKIDRVSAYLKNLAEGGISKGDAMLAYDDILEKGYIEHTFSIRGHKGVLRSRSYADTQRLTSAMEAVRPATNFGYDDIVNRYNLAASLCEWKGVTLKHETTADFDAALKFITALPSPVFGVLLGELIQFDAKLTLIFGDGATEAF